MQVRCPNCRNEQEINPTILERCIVCGEILSDEGKLRCPKIEERLKIPESEVEKKFLCEKCGKNVATYNKKGHMLCEKCRRKKR